MNIIDRNLEGQQKFFFTFFKFALRFKRVRKNRNYNAFRNFHTDLNERDIEQKMHLKNKQCKSYARKFSRTLKKFRIFSLTKKDNAQFEYLKMGT